LERRLAVITSTDLVGFTQLMKQDETGTWEKLCALRKELFKTTTALHNGKIFKATGDWMLADLLTARMRLEPLSQSRPPYMSATSPHLWTNA
jgi:class 3 adenylate cyclase